jgi:GTPase
MRCGTVAIIGRTNVGKSTFLNACLGERIAIVSPLPQTTRDDLLGVVHRPTSQIAFTDTPGFHRPKSELGRRMNQTALDTVRSHDAVVFMTDVAKLGSLSSKQWRPDSDPLHEDDRRLITLLPPETPAILVVNKVDLVRDKGRLLPLLTAFGALRDFAAIIPTSVLSEGGAETILQEIERVLPEAEPSYTEDDLTNKPSSFFVREFIREQVMLSTRREVPHAVAITIERFEDAPQIARIQATIHVEKAGQRVILVGHRGEQIKALGTAARLRIEELLGKKVYLELFVRITERWKDTPRQLRELGYEANGGRDLSNLLPKVARANSASTPRKKTAAKTGRAQGSKPGAKGRPLATKSTGTKPATAKPTAAMPATGKAVGANPGAAKAAAKKSKRAGVKKSGARKSSASSGKRTTANRPRSIESNSSKGRS